MDPTLIPVALYEALESISWDFLVSSEIKVSLKEGWLTFEYSGID